MLASERYFQPKAKNKVADDVWEHCSKDISIQIQLEVLL